MQSFTLYFKALSMDQQQQAESLEALKDIRSIMDRSSRFVSLSGWSGIWAGCIALAASYVAHMMLSGEDGYTHGGTSLSIYSIEFRFLALAAATCFIAGLGAYFFTVAKAKKQHLKVWGAASKKLFISVLIPMLAGGIFCISFLQNGYESYIAPSCLAFYGMALVNGGKYTLGEIRYLGYSELLLGCICLFFPGYGLQFWAVGFGLLHILYGIIMWNRYDKKMTA